MTALQTAVLDLADARDFAFAGGKAVNLAELLGAGFPVPDGFCVGTPAYAQAADTAGIAALLDAPDLPVRARDQHVVRSGLHEHAHGRARVHALRARREPARPGLPLRAHARGVEVRQVGGLDRRVVGAQEVGPGDVRRGREPIR